MISDSNDAEEEEEDEDVTRGGVWDSEEGICLCLWKGLS